MEIELKTLQVPFVDLAAQYTAIADEIAEASASVFRRTDYILGHDVGLFEQEFAAYCGTRYCVGVGSGTAAIQLALEALGVGPGDEVIVPANTFIGSALPALRLGASPVLVDCEEATATVDVDRVAAAIGPRTKAVIAVHLYGQPADVDPLLELCATHDLFLVEDACQAHGARYKGRRAGSLGTVAAFSFYPAKNLGALGDGGAVTTDDEELAKQVRRLSDFGRTDKYVHEIEGTNERLDTIQAAVLRVKLRHLDSWNDLRRDHAETYGRALASSGLMLPVAASWAEHVWHLYVVRVPERDRVLARMNEAGVGAGIHYPTPVHLTPAYAHLGFRAGSFPIAEQAALEILSLPLYPHLTFEQQEYVADSLAAAARQINGGQRYRADLASVVGE